MIVALFRENARETCPRVSRPEQACPRNKLGITPAKKSKVEKYAAESHEGNRSKIIDSRGYVMYKLE
jgi:hypothetical protein